MLCCLRSASHPRLRTALIVVALVACAVVVDGVGGCAGCSAECSGLSQGNEACPCSSDQDCTTRLGTVLLCVAGTCQEGDPPDGDGSACDKDVDCGGGQGCGVDGVCVAAPTCQRIDGALKVVADLDGATVEDLDATRSDCTHAWSAPGQFDVSFTIDIDGAFDFADGADPCDGGQWFASERLGQLACGARTFAVGPADVGPCVTEFAETCPAEKPTCRAVGTSAGVCEQ